MPGGRPRHEVWGNFTIIVEAGGRKSYPDVRCRRCSTEVKNARPAANLMNHVTDCTGLTYEERVKWKLYDENRRLDRASRVKRSRNELLRLEMNAAMIPNDEDFDENRMERAWVLPDPGQQKRDIALAYYSAGFEFCTIENPLVRVALTMNHPQAVLPTRQELSTTILDTTYEHKRFKVIEELKQHQLLGLTTDGWTNNRRMKIINFVLVAPSMRPLFWTTTRVRMAPS